MRKLLFVFILFLTSSSIYTQNQFSNNCIISKTTLESVYFKNKNTFYISSIKNGETIDVIQLFINKADYDYLQQLCINTWAEYKNAGIDEMYKSFNRSFPNISKYEYESKIVYYECLKRFYFLYKYQ